MLPFMNSNIPVLEQTLPVAGLASSDPVQEADSGSSGEQADPPMEPRRISKDHAKNIMGKTHLVSCPIRVLYFSHDNFLTLAISLLTDHIFIVIIQVITVELLG